jgi:cytochrome c-type biogenesis protein CcmH
MILWVLFTLMTLAAIAAVLWPLTRHSVARGGSDIAVYRDQLEEIDRDRAAGLIGATEAEAAKVEVSRRLLAAADAATAAEKSASGETSILRQRVTALAGIALLPVGAIALYLTLGSPDMPGMPLAGRQAAETEANRSLESLIAKVEAHVNANPNDGRAWEVLAPVYMRTGRYDDAVVALRNSLRLNGSNAAREADLGEALVAAANGVVTAEAKGQFERALALDKQDVMARFYMGMAADQDGRRAEAESIWRDIIAQAPPGAAYLEMIRHTLERKAPATASSPPAAAASAAAAEPPQHDVNAMVARLADRLKNNGSDPEGWAQLVRSYRALGQNDKAQAADADARRALAGDPDKLRVFTDIVEKGASAAAVAPAAPVMPPAHPVPVAPAAGPTGPNAADISAAEKLEPNQQNDMIKGMVARLADRLKENRNDIDGWQRLLRAYVVLGERDKAQAAAADARKAFASDADKLRQINDMIKSLGLES